MLVLVIIAKLIVTICICINIGWIFKDILFFGDKNSYKSNKQRFNLLKNWWFFWTSIFERFFSQQSFGYRKKYKLSIWNWFFLSICVASCFGSSSIFFHVKYFLLILAHPITVWMSGAPIICNFFHFLLNTRLDIYQYKIT